MTGRVDTAEGRRLLADVRAGDGNSRLRENALMFWFFDNADGLLAAAEELDACRRDLAEERARTTRLTEALAPFLRYPRYLSIGSIDNAVEVRVSRERFDAARAVLGVRGDGEALAECGAGTEQPA